MSATRRETALLFGDELLANVAAGRTDASSLSDLFATFLPTLTQGRPALERARLTLTALTQGNRWGTEFTTTACEVGRDSARRLNLPEEVQTSLFHVYDLWRGKNGPQGLNGDDIPVGARIARLSGIAVLFESIGGTALVRKAVQRRAGGMLDPNLVALITEDICAWLTDLSATDVREVVLATEPRPQVRVHASPACRRAGTRGKAAATRRSTLRVVKRPPVSRMPTDPSVPQGGVLRLDRADPFVDQLVDHRWHNVPCGVRRDHARATPVTPVGQGIVEIRVIDGPCWYRPPREVECPLLGSRLSRSDPSLD